MNQMFGGEYERFEVEDEKGVRHTIVGRFMPGGVGGAPGTVAYETTDGAAGMANPFVRSLHHQA